MRPSRWFLALPIVLLAALYALVARDILTHPNHIERQPTRAEQLAKLNPLVIYTTPTVRIVRAVVGDKLFLIEFDKRGDVWFYGDSKRASELP